MHSRYRSARVPLGRCSIQSYCLQISTRLVPRMLLLPLLEKHCTLHRSHSTLFGQSLFGLFPRSIQHGLFVHAEFCDYSKHRFLCFHGQNAKPFCGTTFFNDRNTIDVNEEGAYSSGEEWHTRRISLQHTRTRFLSRCTLCTAACREFAVQASSVFEYELGRCARGKRISELLRWLRCRSYPSRMVTVPTKLHSSTKHFMNLQKIVYISTLYDPKEFRISSFL